MYCYKCGQLVNENDLFCFKCGTRLVKPPVCNLASSETFLAPCNLPKDDSGECQQKQGANLKKTDSHIRSNKKNKFDFSNIITLAIALIGVIGVLLLYGSIFYLIRSTYYLFLSSRKTDSFARENGVAFLFVCIGAVFILIYKIYKGTHVNDGTIPIPEIIVGETTYSEAVKMLNKAGFKHVEVVNWQKRKVLKYLSTGKRDCVCMLTANDNDVDPGDRYMPNAVIKVYHF